MGSISTVAGGEFLTLLGPSGSGKTTTLMMVAGFTPPSARRYLLDGRSVTALAAGTAQHRRGVPELRAVSAHDGAARMSASRCACAAQVRSRRSPRRSARRSTLVQLEGFGER